MKAVAIVYAANLSAEAAVLLTDGRSSIDRSLRQIAQFPALDRIIMLITEPLKLPELPCPIESRLAGSWAKRPTLDELAALAQDYDLAYFCWADCPLLDPVLTTALLDRHRRYAAEYSFADGWPYGFAPELLAPGTARALARLAGDDQGRVERDLLFSVIKQDINSFDIETEISKQDLRSYRLSFCADSRRNRWLIDRFLAANYQSADDAASFIKQHPADLRTLPACFTIQVTGACPQACSYCPYPVYSGQAISILERQDFMPLHKFTTLLDKIIDFAGDAVIDISLWGEIALHPEAGRLIEALLARPALATVVETSGLAWSDATLEQLAAVSRQAQPRLNGMAALSWIISLDSNDETHYQQLRGAGFTEAQNFAENCLKLFPDDCYVQAIRFKGTEADLEQFYRSWKTKTNNVIVQKYDDFCGYLPNRKASDLSPLKRPVCWHLMRDFYILIDGTVPRCREDLEKKIVFGNVFNEELATIWQRRNELCDSQIKGEYTNICRDCDEYYTYTF